MDKATDKLAKSLQAKAKVNAEAVGKVAGAAKQKQAPVKKTQNTAALRKAKFKTYAGV